ncbi:energy-coupling factor transporter ATPase [Gracilibacillus alcaliphilus]|uniref:energy-coupling factor transporter ATPase n=1 Tax=Gracilibacillus alcaliphilus TaxID=1401441 RepID=UPI00195CD581|nr:energy-coupling factor transporter ATPase [Gracilibacillus alcaliphilus]MBM7677371.1 energy-coupling factor transport system ATP-binding protein [Gracilibacillus alcaliphilus]
MEITFKDVSYTYQPNTPFSHQALTNMNLTIRDQEFVAVVGHTGSGKSTLLQHINGLLIPSSGEVQIGSFVLSKGQKKQDLKKLREKVGVVFQYPEHQLFEETVERDIRFAMENFHIPKEDIQPRIMEALAQVNLEEEVLAKSPFELSGGQMRRVAIAGVLAMKPEVLILDEPTAGLDPQGQQAIMDLFYRIHKERGTTTILVTHQMADALAYADRIIVLAKGSMLMEGTPEQVFANPDLLAEANLDMPEVLTLLNHFEERFGIHIAYQRQSAHDLAKEMIEKLRET